MSKPCPSIRDLARELNVSHVTVSMALRDHPRISTSRRRQVRELADRLGYRPDPMLSSLIAYRQDKRTSRVTSTLAWINRWPRPADLRRWQEFEGYFEGARAAAEKLGYRVEEFIVSPQLTAARLGQILTTRAVSGLLIPPHPSVVSWSDFALDWSQFSVVRFGFSALDLRAHMVGCDQMRGAELAVRRIAALGYRRIGYVTAPRFDTTTDGNFRMGFLRGVEADPALARIAPLILDEESPAALAPWLRRWRPDAILSSESRLPPLLRELGIDVPGGIALAGSSVRDCSGFSAGIDQNPLEIGRVAAHTLIDLVNRRERGTSEFCRRVLVEGGWVDGPSLPAKTAKQAKLAKAASPAEQAARAV